MSHIRISAAEFRQQNRVTKNKYRAQKCEIDGITFDSQREGSHYRVLRQRQIDDEIVGLELQKPFALTVEGRLIGTYRADFAFFDVVEDRHRVQDVKGYDTPLSKWKRKHVLAQYGVHVEIVK